MITSSDPREIIKHFEDLVMASAPIRKKTQDHKQKSSKPELRNPIKRKGLAYQSRQADTGNSPKVDGEGQAVKEQALHDMIVAHPYLLHTPELYAGGLYLDALLNKYTLPCRLTTDFTYITVQGSVVKITLVEIEKSSKKVFDNKLLSRSTFLFEAEDAINQVRSWRERMRPDYMKKALLDSIKPLFEGYPVPIFGQDGEPSKLVKIEIGYVLVVGNQGGHHPAHQTMIDRLYLDEGIIFMTYPMMIDQVKANLHQKNVIKLGPHGIQAVTLAKQDALAPIAEPLNLPALSDDDPFGIKVAGLGWRLNAGTSRACALHPGSIKEIFYRSQGVCEKPGCGKQVVREDHVDGHFSPIYNVVDDDSDCETFWNTDHVALTCSEHLYRINGHEHYVLGKGHPMSQGLAQRWPYRPDLDMQSLRFTKHWQERMMDSLPGILDINTQEEPELSRSLINWAKAANSLSWRCQLLLGQIVEDHFRGRRTYRIDRAANLISMHAGFFYLHKARLIRINRYAPKGFEIEPEFFTHSFIDRIELIFGGRAMMAVTKLCQGDVDGLRIALKSERDDALQSGRIHQHKGHLHR